MDGLIRVFRWEAPLHLLMAAVMVPTMVWHSAALSLAGAALLVVVSIAYARCSRQLPFLRAHIVDLWAMALMLIVLAPSVPLSGHGHGARLDTGLAVAAVMVGWAVLRLALLRGMPVGSRLGPAVSAGLTAAGLAVMVGFCA